MKLFIDDIRNAPDDSWTVARTVTEAIRAINRFDFEVISLDHDISHQVTIGQLSRPYPCDETFASVTYFIKEKYKGETDYTGPKIIIHTSNPSGAADMVAILNESGIVPELKMMGLTNRLEMEI